MSDRLEAPTSAAVVIPTGSTSRYQSSREGAGGRRRLSGPLSSASTIAVCTSSCQKSAKRGAGKWPRPRPSRCLLKSEREAESAYQARMRAPTLNRAARVSGGEAEAAAVAASLARFERNHCATCARRVRRSPRGAPRGVAPSPSQLREWESASQRRSALSVCAAQRWGRRGSERRASFPSVPRLPHGRTHSCLFSFFAARNVRTLRCILCAASRFCWAAAPPPAPLSSAGTSGSSSMEAFIARPAGRTAALSGGRGVRCRNSARAAVRNRRASERLDRAYVRNRTALYDTVTVRLSALLHGTLPVVCDTFHCCL